MMGASRLNPLARMGLSLDEQYRAGSVAKCVKTISPATMRRFLILLSCALAGASIAGAQSAGPVDEPVQLAPVSVSAGPLAYLGLTCSLDVGLFAFVSSNARIKGMTIVKIADNSPAQRAGLMANDHVLQIDGTPITDYTIKELKAVREKEKGDRMEFVVQASDAKASRTVELIVGAQPKPRS